MAIVLFTNEALGLTLCETTRRMVDRLERWDPEALLKAPEADVVAELIKEGTTACPRLRHDDAWMPDPSEVVQKLKHFGDVVERLVTRFVLVVPFDGAMEVFTLRADTYGPNPPRVQALRPGEIRIAVDGPSDDPTDVRAQFDAQLDKVEEYLRWSRKQIEQHNTQIIGEVPGMVSRRRSQLRAARNLQAQLGFPIRRRPDADTYAVPIKRRALRPVRAGAAPATPFKPEPAMVDSDYQAALAVLRNSRNALERTPSLAQKLDEEQIRDLLLVNLNAHFEGDAAGEVFNGAGKTDILIRVDDRNIFIGECKIWAGPSTMDEALGQIFSYLVWRDTKAAILLFIRNKGVAAAIQKAAEKIEAHPNYKRRGPLRSDDQLDFVMRAQDDPDRQIQLALLPFALRTKPGVPTV
ncbi:hypothetical protein EDC02_7109 [Micromonospora sp. Llam0]|uniref:hypothetical protein n=1 Tax=Micromonospora sp. Llam0 TaxID=2485143 RepID=UPI000F47C8A4|nr:hypothetical protein [Micromonospora sp. Llam0]ROO52202.1 hypothetical protein EDC02_7109 [Micromonospora sp. Llam0]